jgi:hypothetical protein
VLFLYYSLGLTPETAGFSFLLEVCAYSLLSVKIFRFNCFMVFHSVEPQILLTGRFMPASRALAADAGLVVGAVETPALFNLFY